MKLLADRRNPATLTEWQWLKLQINLPAKNARASARALCKTVEKSVCSAGVSVLVLVLPLVFPTLEHTHLSEAGMRIRRQLFLSEWKNGRMGKQRGETAAQPHTHTVLQTVNCSCTNVNASVPQSKSCLPACLLCCTAHECLVQLPFPLLPIHPSIHHCIHHSAAAFPSFGSSGNGSNGSSSTSIIGSKVNICLFLRSPVTRIMARCSSVWL